VFITEHKKSWPRDRLLLMSDSLIRISSVEQDGDDGLIVMFSDGTTAGYVVEELLELRPIRLRAGRPKGTESSANNSNPLVAD
jgi:hypothetical protein